MSGTKSLVFAVALACLLTQSCARAVETTSPIDKQSVSAQQASPGGQVSSDIEPALEGPLPHKQHAQCCKMTASTGAACCAAGAWTDAVPDADALMKDADTFYELGRYRDAADAYRRVVRIYSDALDAVASQMPAVTADATVSVDIGGGVRLDFVLIKPGTFKMGTTDGESDEVPVHAVTITKPFYLGRVEVTQRQWVRVMDTDPSRFKGPDMPVDSVSWYDCEEFLKKLNEISPGHDFRLPTEAEWEYACRAGTTSRWWFGGDEMPMEPFGWVDTTSLNDPHPVGRLQPNPWGLYDMHGNLWEWCSDWWGHDYYGQSPSSDPQGPEYGDKKVLRGGSFSNPGPYSRSANRGYFDPTARRNNYGFRIAWTVK